MIRLFSTVFRIVVFSCWMAFCAWAVVDVSDDPPQGFILVMQDGAMDADLKPLLSEFGPPAKAWTQVLSALNMIILNVPTSWQLTPDAFCKRAMQIPAIEHCTPDAVLQSRPQSMTELRTELDNYNSCKPWYLGVKGRCPTPVNPTNPVSYTHLTLPTKRKV